MPRLIPRTGWHALILTPSTAAAAAAQSRPAQILRYIGQTLNPEPTMSLDTLQYSGPGSATYYHKVDRGGHFAGWEEPRLVVAELRAAFQSLR